MIDRDYIFRSIWRFAQLCALLFAVVSLQGCGEGKRPFLQARVCLQSKADIESFLSVLREAGKVSQMSYFDRTAETQDEAAAIGNSARIRGDNFALNVGVLRKDGMGVTAGELPGPGYPVGLGFSDGGNSAEARAFASSLIALMRKRWRVDVIPGNEGLKPGETCKHERLG